MKATSFWLALCALAALPVVSTQATITYEFYVDPPTVVTPYTLNIPLDVYLQETATQGEPSQLTPGLQSAGVKLTRLNPLPSSPAIITNAVPNLSFDDPLHVTVTPSSAMFQAYIVPDTLRGPMPVLISREANATVYRIMLGTFFVESGAPFQTTHFQFEDPDPLITDTAPLLGSQLDPVTVTPFTLTTIPEPASASLLVGATLLLLTRRRN